MQHLKEFLHFNIELNFVQAVDLVFSVHMVGQRSLYLYLHLRFRVTGV